MSSAEKSAGKGDLSAAITAEIALITARLKRNAPIDSMVRELATARVELKGLEAAFTALKDEVSASLGLFEVLLPRRATAPSEVTTVAITADMPLRAENGFLGMEYDRHGGVYRWIGPNGTCLFELFLSRREPLLFELAVNDWNPIRPNRISALVDGAPVALACRAEPDSDTNSVIVSGILPACDEIGVTRIEFHVQKSFVPSMRNSRLVDSRSLAIAFTALKVRPASASELELYQTLAVTVGTKGIDFDGASADAAASSDLPQPHFDFTSAAIVGKLATGDEYSHLDLEVKALSFEGQRWPSIRLKFQCLRNKLLIELRKIAGWPEMFEVWPESKEDKWGPYLQIGEADAGTLANSLTTERDKALLRAVAAALPAIVTRLDTRDDFTASERTQWIARAERLSSVWTEPVQDQT